MQLISICSKTPGLTAGRFSYSNIWVSIYITQLYLIFISGHLNIFDKINLLSICVLPNKSKALISHPHKYKKL